MLVSNIIKAVLDRIDTAVTAGDVIRTAKPREDRPFDAGNTMYAELFISPLEAETRAFCGDIKQGFIHVNVYAPSDSGIGAPTEEAEKFINLFSEGLEFDGITIPYPTSPREAQTDRENNGWFFIPAPIYFEAG